MSDPAIYLELLRSAHLAAIEDGGEMTGGEAFGLGSRIDDNMQFNTETGFMDIPGEYSVPTESQRFVALADAALAKDDMGLTHADLVGLLVNQFGLSQSELAYAWDIPTYVVMRDGQRQSEFAPEFYTGNPLDPAAITDAMQSSAYRPNNRWAGRQGKDISGDTRTEFDEATGTFSQIPKHPDTQGPMYEHTNFFLPNSALGWGIEAAAGAVFSPTGMRLARIGGGRLLGMMARNLENMLPASVLGRFQNASTRITKPDLTLIQGGGQGGPAVDPPQPPRGKPYNWADETGPPPGTAGGAEFDLPADRIPDAFPEGEVVPFPTDDKTAAARQRLGERRRVSPAAGQSEALTRARRAQMDRAIERELEVAGSDIIAAHRVDHPTASPVGMNEEGTGLGIEYLHPYEIDVHGHALFTLEQSQSIRRIAEEIQGRTRTYRSRNMDLQDFIEEVRDHLTDQVVWGQRLTLDDIAELQGIDLADVTEAHIQEAVNAGALSEGNAAELLGHGQPGTGPFVRRQETPGQQALWDEIEETRRAQWEGELADENRTEPFEDAFGPEHDVPIGPEDIGAPGADFQAMQARGRAEARTWFDNLSDEHQATAIAEWEKSSKPHYTDPDHVFDPADDYDVRNAYTAVRRATGRSSGPPVGGGANGGAVPTGFAGDPRMQPTVHIGGGADGKGPVVRISSNVIYHTGSDNVLRPMIIVDMGDGRLQPFYRRSGRGSEATAGEVERITAGGGGSGGQWVPFDGLGDQHSGANWFRKNPYTINGPDHPLFRYGTEELKYIGEMLDESPFVRDMVGGEGQVIADLPIIEINTGLNGTTNVNELNEILGVHDIPSYGALPEPGQPRGPSGRGPVSPMREPVFDWEAHLDPDQRLTDDDFIAGFEKLGEGKGYGKAVAEGAATGAVLGSTSAYLFPEEVKKVVGGLAELQDSWWTWIKDFPDHLDWVARATGATLDGMEKATRSTGNQVVDLLNDGFRQQTNSLLTDLNGGVIPMMGKADAAILQGASRDLSRQGYDGQAVFSNDIRKEIEAGDAMVVGYRTEKDYERALEQASQYGLEIDRHFWRKPSRKNIRPGRGEPWTRDHLKKLATTNHFYPDAGLRRGPR